MLTTSETLHPVAKRNSNKHLSLVVWHDNLNFSNSSTVRDFLNLFGSLVVDKFLAGFVRIISSSHNHLKKALKVNIIELIVLGFNPSVF